MKDPIKIVEECMKSGEPFFVIRAKDKCSIAALAAYNTTSYLLDVDDTQLKETQKFLGEFMEWRDANPDKVKLPD